MSIISICQVAFCFLVCFSVCEGQNRHRIESHAGVSSAEISDHYEHPKIISPLQVRQMRERAMSLEEEDRSHTNEEHASSLDVGVDSGTDVEESLSEATVSAETRSETNVSTPEDEDVQEETPSEDEDFDMMNPCGRDKACTSEEEADERRIKIVKKQLLKSLRMSTAPTPNITNQLPRTSTFFHDLYNKYRRARGRQIIADLDEEPDKIKTKHIITTAKPPPFETWRSKADWFYFDIAEEEVRNFEAKSAILYVYVLPVTTGPTNATLEVADYRTGFNYTVQDLDVVLARDQAQKIHFNKRHLNGFWQKIDLTTVVQRWMQRRDQNFGVDISSKGIPNLIAKGRDGTDQDHVPYLKVKLHSVTSKRKKRDALMDCTGSENRCCRRSFLVTFEQIGWDWIIMPTEMNLRYCGGTCSVTMVTNQRASFVLHTDVGNAEQKKTCCVPKFFSPISMLYYDHNSNIVYSEIPQMIIDSCDCV